MNAGALYAFLCAPFGALLVAAMPFPLRLEPTAGVGRAMWFWTGFVWLGTFVVGAAAFTAWWAGPGRWWGTFHVSHLFLPLWVLTPGLAVAVVRLTRRIKVLARTRNTTS
ncbi:hypothetical protein HC031_07295 [Planosporangium thailandense]|uniref:Integral membrane protein n=1 Tax=Planosporangium thailandense TaxID=765197 RepID=A0ABX0XU41_9ACTN|nr:hypothetical protein [Planosporangium thailandense]NJC69526.1 hypothetical protein [Planosporangium thailandense]